MNKLTAAVLAAGLPVVVGSITANATSPTAEAASYVDAVLYGSGCGKPLEVMAISKQGTQLGKRTLVNGKRDVAFEAHGTSSDNKRFIFSTYNCTTKAHALYMQSVTPRPTARQILTLPPGW